MTKAEICAFVDCANGWILYNNYCYLLESTDTAIVWNEAERRCVEHGSHLTSVMDETEMLFLYGLLLDQRVGSLPNAYIGKPYIYFLVSNSQ